MPMRKEDYPDDWDAIAGAIKDAASWICRHCGLQCQRPSEPFDTHRRTMSVHHIGVPKPDGSPGDPHDKMDVRPENLIALCSRCHLRADRDLHVRNAARTRRRKRLEAGQRELFACEGDQHDDH